MDHLQIFPKLSNKIDDSKDKEKQENKSSVLFNKVEEVYKDNIQNKQNENDKLKDIKAEKIGAVIKIQSAIKGWHIRNNIFLPWQIKPFLDKHIIGYSDEQKNDIARILCRELNTMSTEPQKYKNKSIKLETLLNAYEFTMPETPTRQISRPFDLWLEMNDKSNSINILIVPNEQFSAIGKPLAAGSFKTAYRAQEFDVDLLLDDEGMRKLYYTPKVLLKSHDLLSHETVEKGLKIHREVIENCTGNFAEIPKTPSPDISGTVSKTEKNQTWYNNDLHTALETNQVALDFSSNPKTVPFTMKAKMDVFMDIVRSVEAMHEKGYVHRDVKTDNILLKANRNKIEGYLADFDLAQKMGSSDVKAKPVHWDALSRAGIVYPFTDNYSLTIALGMVLMPYFYQKGFCESPHNLHNSIERDIFVSLSASYYVYNALVNHSDPGIQSLSKIFVIAKNTTTHEIELATLYTLEELQDGLKTALSKFTTIETKGFIENLVKELLVIEATAELIGQVGYKNYTMEEDIKKEPGMIDEALDAIDLDPESFYKFMIDEGFITATELRIKIEEIRNLLL